MTIIRGKRSGFVLLALLVTLALTVSGGVVQEKGDKKEDAKDKKEEKKDKKKEGLPLEPTRTIEFTTDEATWLSLDVSPDGRTLVFELLGDLYTLPLEGGQATRISDDMAFDSQPRFSPDGQRIAFLSDRDGAENLWIMQ
ncbi:MAG: TolB family protein, partial [Terriglobia bacterium]